MSKSYLRNKHMRQKYDGSSFFASKMLDKVRNHHRQDEMPKNRPSKYIEQNCNSIKVAWLQEPGSFGGHKPHKGGHRMVSGIVRAKVKAKCRKLIDSDLLDQ